MYFFSRGISSLSTPVRVCNKLCMPFWGCIVGGCIQWVTFWTIWSMSAINAIVKHHPGRERELNINSQIVFCVQSFDKTSGPTYWMWGTSFSLNYHLDHMVLIMIMAWPMVVKNDHWSIIIGDHFWCWSSLVISRGLLRPNLAIFRPTASPRRALRGKGQGDDDDDDSDDDDNYGEREGVLWLFKMFTHVTNIVSCRSMDFEAFSAMSIWKSFPHGIFPNIPEYSQIFLNIPEYSWIFPNISKYSLILELERRLWQKPLPFKAFGSLTMGLTDWERGEGGRGTELENVTSQNLVLSDCEKCWKFAFLSTFQKSCFAWIFSKIYI